MARYDFYIGFLRFVAARTECETPEISAMMAELSRMADELAETDCFTVKQDKMALAGRALAGVAGLLQQSILPEVVAAGNKTGEAQVRWVIDTSMEQMSLLTARAEISKAGDVYQATLPEPPAI